MPGIVANADKYEFLSLLNLTNAQREMSASLANVTGITSCTSKLVENVRTEIKRNIVLIEISSSSNCSLAYMCNSIHLRAAEKKAFVRILSQIKLLFGPLVIHIVWYILKQLFTSVSV